jgi:hypothetical protein
MYLFNWRILPGDTEQPFDRSGPFKGPGKDKQDITTLQAVDTQNRLAASELLKRSAVIASMPYAAVIATARPEKQALTVGVPRSTYRHPRGR